VRPDPDRTDELETVHGVHAVRELVEARRRDVERLFVLRERASSLGRILRLARQAGVPVSYVDRPTLARKVGARAVHQGIAAVVAPLPYADADELSRRAIEDPAGLLVLVDRVEDAGNLGAIVRTAAASGATGALLSAEGTVGLSAGVARASAGAAERLPVAREARPSWRVAQLREAGFLTIVLDPRGDVPWDRVDLTGRLLVVAGGEARGARPGIRDACELRISIPVAPAVESLNVAVATAVLLFEAVRQRRRRPSLASSGPG
jgi:23S rRNA (guanosine2251-2'-O)-methyltransferase